jgi:hypothetical protein
MAGFGFKITDLDKSLIAIQKAIGRPLTLKLGELVKAEVVDVFADGGVSLKIKGSFLAAKTEVPLLKDSTVLFKVLGSTGSDVAGRDLRLQFKGYADSPAALSEQTAAKLLQAETVTSLMRDFSAILSGSDKTNAFPAFAEKLMKTLPAEPDALPRELRVQLQDLLKIGLSTTGRDIRGRIEELVQQLQSQLEPDSIPESLSRNMTVDIQKITPEVLKSGIENTGVILEARLKSMLIDELSLLDRKDRKPMPEAIGARGAEITAQVSDPAGQAKNDLKAGLVQLRELLMEKHEKSLVESGSPTGIAPEKGDMHENTPVKHLLQTVDGLLRDIDTFQLLSKTTDSFCTFLPLLWKEMREGDIAFKRGHAPGGGRSYYCMMNLDFESMGSLSIMVMMRREEFFASFKASDLRLGLLLEEHARELQRIFRENGMNLKAVNVLGKEDTSLAPFERLENLESILSIRI